MPGCDIGINCRSSITRRRSPKSAETTQSRRKLIHYPDKYLVLSKSSAATRTHSSCYKYRANHTRIIFRSMTTTTVSVKRHTHNRERNFSGAQSTPGRYAPPLTASCMFCTVWPTTGLFPSTGGAGLASELERKTTVTVTHSCAFLSSASSQQPARVAHASSGASMVGL